jgi:hypothetical protein
MNKRQTYYLTHKTQKLAYASRYYQTNKELRLMQGRERWRTHRLIMLNLLGNSCSNPSCPIPKGCMNPLCLNIDHKNGDGYLDKKRFKGPSETLRYYLKHPEEAKLKLQILCSYCHCLKTLENKENQSGLRRGKTSSER